MTTIVTRAGKGSSLTWVEGDANFTNLNNDKLEVNPALGTPVSGTLTNCTGLPAAGVTGTALVSAAIGTTVQAYNATLAAIAAQTEAANKVQYYTADNTPGLLDFKDEDNMVSDSATAVPSQQSVKAYVDTSIAAISLATITLATPQASTSGTIIDFTSIPAGTKRITVNLDGVSTNGSDAVMLQLGDSGGVETSSYSGSNGGANFSTGFSFSGAVSTCARYGTLTLTLMNSSTNKWACSGVIGRSDAANADYVGGTKALSAVLDRVRITTTGGTNTFDAGEINITYES